MTRGKIGKSGRWEIGKRRKRDVVATGREALLRVGCAGLWTPLGRIRVDPTKSDLSLGAWWSTKHPKDTKSDRDGRRWLSAQRKGREREGLERLTRRRGDAEGRPNPSLSDQIAPNPTSSD